MMSPVGVTRFCSGMGYARSFATTVIASKAEQSSFGAEKHKRDCFVAGAPRNDG
jgi:hypothetical protein